MTKDNILFGIVGLLAGLIIGFFVTNAINQGAPKSGAAAMPNAPGAMQSGNSNMPPNHPNIGTTTSPAPKTLDQAAVDKAKAEPNNFDAQFAAAEAYYAVDNYDEATAFLLKANKLKPDDYETLVNLGNAYYDSGKFPEAEKWYNQALVQKPENNDVRTDLGLTFLLRQPADYDRAIQEFTDVLKKDPNHRPAAQNMIVANVRKGDAVKAQEALANFEKIAPNHPSVPKLKEELAKISAK